jgi:hypothetical protein
MSGFAQPAPKTPQIPQPVPLEQTDPSRQGMYNELIKANKELEAPLVGASTTTVSSEKQSFVAAPAPQDPPTVSDMDKRNFLRAILGGKDYEKKYKLFDTIEVTMVDRSVELTEKMYDQLEADQKDKKIKLETEEAWDVWADRYQMAAVVRGVSGVQNGTTYPAPENFLERVQLLMKFPKPVYGALMEASRNFEEHVIEMTAKAQDPDFWRAGGKNLR